MGKDTAIEWTDHSRGFWAGCAKVAGHPGCAHCYAEAFQVGRLKRDTWGKNKPRVYSKNAAKDILAWNAAAKKAGRVETVFLNPESDFFEEHSGPVVNSKGERLAFRSDKYEPDDPTCAATPNSTEFLTLEAIRTYDAFQVIDRCQNLIFIILTKRPENARQMWPGPLEDFGTGRAVSFRSNVYLVYSASDQPSLEKGVEHLQACRDLCPVIGLSLEPLLGPVDLKAVRPDNRTYDLLTGWNSWLGVSFNKTPTVQWVIVGGESGPHARPCDVAWVRSIIRQCRAAGIPCFVKQLGREIQIRNDSHAEWPHEGDDLLDPYDHQPHFQGEECIVRTADGKGGDPAEWPADLRVREYPTVTFAETK